MFEFIKKNISKLFNSKIRENVIDEENTCMKSETDEVKEEYVVIVAKSGLNIRQEPSIESEKVGIIDYGEKVKS